VFYLGLNGRAPPSYEGTDRLTSRSFNDSGLPSSVRLDATVPALCGLAGNHRRNHPGGNVTSAGWQVTLCDPMWHVSSRSGVTTLRTAIHLLLTLRHPWHASRPTFEIVGTKCITSRPSFANGYHFSLRTTGSLSRAARYIAPALC